MSNLKRYAFQLASALVLFPLLTAGARTTVVEISAGSPELPLLNINALQGHALELSSTMPRNKDWRKDILKAIRASIPSQYRNRAFEIARAVIVESNHHQLDPFFLLAVIKTESQFNIKARGRHGEIGLMQIMPATGKWLAAQAGLSARKLNLYDPKVNIRIGATYFASLRKEFGGYSARYIGAYNMGSGNVRRLMASNVDPEVYPGKVLSNYRDFYKSAVNVAKTDKTEKSKSPSISKKLETRNVPNRCGTVRCQRLRYQPAMPAWIAG